MASIPPETVKLDMKEQNAKQGKQTVMTNFVKIFPVLSGNNFFLIKKKPKRIKITVFAMLVQSDVELKALARLSPIFESAAKIDIGIIRLPPLREIFYKTVIDFQEGY